MNSVQADGITIAQQPARLFTGRVQAHDVDQRGSAGRGRLILQGRDALVRTIEEYEPTDENAARSTDR